MALEDSLDTEESTKKREPTLPNISTEDRLEIDRLVDLGFSLRAIADVVEPTYETVRTDIIVRGKYDEWEVNKENVKLDKEKERQQRKPLLENLVSTLNTGMQELISILKTGVDQLVQNEPWPVQKALEYLDSKRWTPYSLTSLTTIFERYEKAENSGVKLSLEQLGEGLGIHFVSVGRILHQVGLESMYYSWDRRVTPKEKKAAIRRAHPLDLLANDTAYFIELPRYIVRDTFTIIGTRPQRKRLKLHFGKWEVLTYAKASQIYQAEDLYKAEGLGFRVNDIVELVNGTNEAMVRHVHDHKHMYMWPIIHALRTLFDTKDIDTPYVTSEQRQKLLS